MTDETSGSQDPTPQDPSHDAFWLDDASAPEALDADASRDSQATVAAPAARGRITPWRVVGAIVLLMLALTGWSAGAYITKPGTDTLAARLSGWARDHKLGVVVNKLEEIQYNLNKPKTGGTPKPIAIASQSPAPSVAPSVPFTPGPARIASQAGPALADEGVWQTLISHRGVPVVRSAFVRPDSQHTSFLTAVAWMDQLHLRFVLHPGTIEPGGSGWKTASVLQPAEFPYLAAAFNSGFKLEGARGGYYSEGRTAKALRDGAASLVIFKNGKASIGQWGRDISMNPDIVSVRQNLDLLVDNGVLADSVDENNTPKWGYTLGNESYVWRSGIGITKTGALVYAAGNALSVRTIGQVLQAAGAVRAMELDINPEWTTYYWFEHPPGGPMVPHKLAQDMQKPADRYLHTSSRDFVSVHIR